MRTRIQSVPQVQIVTFRLGADEFGLDVFSVHEILRQQPVTAVPQAPAFVEGVIDVRGALIPVVDLRTRFELPARADAAEARIAIVQYGAERLGLVVDAVTEVLRVAETAISEPPAYLRGLAAEFMRGVVRLPERLIVLIDVERILASEERIALELAGLAAGVEDAGDVTHAEAAEG
jgi:purine-binding chemotaxis protein CheW